MEVHVERIAESEIGPQIAAGRDSAIFALGEDRVLRRASGDRSYEYEAGCMEALRGAGYPVPQVYAIGPGEMVLERVQGLTMMADLGRRPWKLDTHARLLADLHVRLHELPAPPGLKPGPVAGGSVLHLDLHPANVILSPDGPVLIDWTNVAVGDPAVDVAVSWLILAVFEADETGLMRALVALLRKRLVRTFLAAAGRDAAVVVLPAVAEYRMADRNVRPTEREAIRKLVAENCPTP